MILDAREWLLAAAADFTDPVESGALDDFLTANGAISVVPSVIDGGKVVWLFTGEVSQIAIPLALLPAMTRSAREGGLLAEFHAAFVAEVNELIEAVRSSLQPEAPCKTP